MKALVPRHPLSQNLADFRREFDQMFNRFFDWHPFREEQALTEGFIPAIEASIDKDGKRFQCHVMLPGVDAKDVNLQVLGNTLTISGERSSSRETKGSDYLHREITYGSFQRSIELPEGVDKDKLTAEYRNGVLEISAPVSAGALPRKIEVKTLPGAKSAGA
ncbi:MAG TPA: Hsp20/alpha crystallin family protein [Candidatus Eremiobacteraceae bacterium]|nr:Hsp20/alpha crystallin family protein [Candidatus Eremiobacteraceae bacterium]